MSDPKKLYANINFDVVKNESIEKALERQELAYKYLYHLNKSSKILNDPKGLTALNYIFYNTNAINSIDQINIGITYDFVKILITIIENAYNRLIECFNVAELNEINIKNRTGSLIVTLMVIEILNKFTFCSKKFCNRFHEENGLRTMFNLMNNRKIQENYFEFKNNPNSEEFVLMKGIIKTIYFSIVNLARVYENYKSQWKECNSIKNLLYYLNQSSDLIENKINLTITIGYIIEDSDILKYAEVKQIIADLSKLTGSCSRKIETKRKLKRAKLKVDDRVEDFEVCCLCNSGTEWNLIDLFKSIYHLAVFDKIKQQIYFDNNLNKCLRSILYNGNEIELEYALMLLNQLCFDKKIAQDINSDKQLYNCINSISKDGEFNTNIILYSNSVLWLIETYSSKTETLFQDAMNKNKHIMISYNRQNKDICLQLKQELEKLNYKVFMDAGEISGTSIKEMNSAVENCLCFLMCITEKYKQNSYSRLEAEYAFRLGKPIVPIIMQNDYLLDGWYLLILI